MLDNKLIVLHALYGHGIDLAFIIFFNFILFLNFT